MKKNGDLITTDKKASLATSLSNPPEFMKHKMGTRG